MVWLAVQPLARNLPETCPQHYLTWYRQVFMVQTKPHSQPHTVSVKDLQIFALSQALLDVLHWNWQPNQEPILLPLPILQPGGTHPILSWWIQAHLNPYQGCHLLQEGFGLSSSPRLHGRGAGQDMILPKVRWPWTKVLLIQVIWYGPSYWQPRPQGLNEILAMGHLQCSSVSRPVGAYPRPKPPSAYLHTKSKPNWVGITCFLSPNN